MNAQGVQQPRPAISNRLAPQTEYIVTVRSWEMASQKRTVRGCPVSWTRGQEPMDSVLWLKYSNGTRIAGVSWCCKKQQVVGSIERRLRIAWSEGRQIFRALFGTPCRAPAYYRMTAYRSAARTSIRSWSRLNEPMTTLLRRCYLGAANSDAGLRV